MWLFGSFVSKPTFSHWNQLTRNHFIAVQNAVAIADGINMSKWSWGFILGLRKSTRRNSKSVWQKEDIYREQISFEWFKEWLLNWRFRLNCVELSNLWKIKWPAVEVLHRVRVHRKFSNKAGTTVARRRSSYSIRTSPAHRRSIRRMHVCRKKSIHPNPSGKSDKLSSSFYETKFGVDAMRVSVCLGVFGTPAPIELI